VIKRWDEQYSSKGSTEIARRIALWHLSEVSLASKQFLDIYGFIESMDFKALCHYELDYCELTPSDAYNLRQVLALFSKRQDLDIGCDKREVALVKFREAEQLCLETNRIFKSWTRGDLTFTSRVESVFHSAQRKISRILGNLPSLSELNLRFGPGATTTVVKRMASARRKLGEAFTCSEELLSIASAVLEEMPAWVPFEKESESVLVALEVHPCKLSFVPKSAKTDRAIAVEPMLNTMCQLGIGDYIASRLRREGIDIKDQSRNQNAARLGSLTGELATLDLSSASDTVAIELVYHLLPIDWFLFLSKLRTGKCDVEGKVEVLQKFSSMGNGFTFPLETLLFYALAVSCVRSEDVKLVSVYGDDIIIPTYAYPLLNEVLTAAGFLLNASKSFASGPFRESCGKDYLSGIDIRPYYCKGPFLIADLFTFHNYYVRRGLDEAALIVLEYIPKSLRKYGPDGYGDGHLLGDFVPIPYNRHLGWSGYTFQTFSFKARRSLVKSRGDAVFPLYAIYAQPPRLGIPGMEPSTLERIGANYGRRAAFHNVAKSSVTHRKGELSVVTPGVQGYKVLSIYVLD